MYQRRPAAAVAAAEDAAGASTSASAGVHTAAAAAAAPPPSPQQPQQQQQQQPQAAARLHPLTLQFSDPAAERAYIRAASDAALVFDRGSHALHMAIAALHCGYAAYLATGSLASPEALALTAPYAAAAAAHWWLSRRGRYPRERARIVLVLEAVYGAICVASMPRWVLAPVEGWRSYLRVFVLGSGVLISAWLTAFCVKPVFWLHYVTIPIEFAAQTFALTRPTCAALTATPYGAAATSAVARALDAAAAATAAAAPACPRRSGGDGGELLGTAAASAAAAAAVPAAASCASLQAAWQVFAAAALLYARYRVERSARRKFAERHNFGRVPGVWPPVPAPVSALLHAAVALQFAAAVWAWLGCAPLLLADSEQPAL